MSDFLNLLVTVVCLMVSAWLYTSASRPFLRVFGLVLVIAWGARLVLSVVLA